ncbi:hypothetical protein ZIOFF_025203 [Zingiber officinale]|uniref:Uncharacterized protein n=1 Tax=Zingiber officinale TaxID=94328 RepID=A0A8J5H3E4_ZINOF|nr:hypothetical protein ZIOFF_025203 [Zingiber officinale]
MLAVRLVMEKLPCPTHDRISTMPMEVAVIKASAGGDAVEVAGDLRVLRQSYSSDWFFSKAVWHLFCGELFREPFDRSGTVRTLSVSRVEAKPEPLERGEEGLKPAHGEKAEGAQSCTKNTAPLDVFGPVTPPLLFISSWCTGVSFLLWIRRRLPLPAPARYGLLVVVSFDRLSNLRAFHVAVQEAEAVSGGGRWPGCSFADEESSRRRLHGSPGREENPSLSSRFPHQGWESRYEWERPKPPRRPDIFPQFSPMKTPLPHPLPEDPPEEDEEEEEEQQQQEEEEEKPDEEDPEKPEQSRMQHEWWF